MPDQSQHFINISLKVLVFTPDIFVSQNFNFHTVLENAQQINAIDLLSCPLLGKLYIQGSDR